jgi:hypothetical protein
MKKKGGSLCFSWGDYGGFYFHRSYTMRLCLGWFAITYFPLEIDIIINNLIQKNENRTGNTTKD